VIGAQDGAIPELVTPETGVLVRPRDANALADGIVAFYARNPERLGRGARARVERDFTWDSAMRGLLDLYRATLVTRPAGTPGYATS